MAQLRILSPSLTLFVSEDRELRTLVYDGWRARDTWEHGAGVHDGNEYGTYRLVIECDVTTHSECRDRYYNGIELSERVDKLWGVATGLPLRHFGYSPGLTVVGLPHAWTSNESDVDTQLQAAETGLIIRFAGGGMVHRRVASTFPAQAIVSALVAEANADEVTRHLLGLHFAGSTSTSPDGTEVLFAKALEIVRALLPGRTDSQREHNLPAEVRAELTRPFRWLFQVANTRRETRHAVRRRNPVLLHSALSNDESLAYLRNADRVIRGALCSQLRIPFVHIAYPDERDAA